MPSSQKNTGFRRDRNLPVFATALRTLDREIAYSRRKWGVAHAEKYRQELMDTIRKLAANPKTHPEKPELGEGICITTSLKGVCRSLKKRI